MYKLTLTDEERRIRMQATANRANVSIPRAASPEVLIKKYYSEIELFNSDIKEIFPDASLSTINKLKKLAKTRMLEEDIPVYNGLAVNTEVAYRAWGLDIAKIERRYDKLKKFGMMHGTEDTKRSEIDAKA